jgi:hypothetical protein
MAMNKGKLPARRKQSARGSVRPRQPAISEQQPPFETEQVVIGASNLSLHDLFQQQAAAMLARTDIDEEAKQQILVAMACPCCGAGAMSYTVKLKR